MQHRSRTAASILRDLLARRSRLPVHEVTTPGAAVLPGHVYLAPPDRHLVVTADRHFALMNGRRIRHVRSSANPLFESAAEAFGPDVVAVVLTGGDSDATDGVQSVKAMGGYVLAHDPASAQARWMPAAAIASGAVDRVLSLEAIPPALVRTVADGGDAGGGDPGVASDVGRWARRLGRRTMHVARR